MVSLIPKEVAAVPGLQRKRKRKTRRKKEIDSNSNRVVGEEQRAPVTATDITTIDRAINKSLWIDWIVIMI